MVSCWNRSNRWQTGYDFSSRNRYFRWLRFRQDWSQRWDAGIGVTKSADSFSQPAKNRRSWSNGSVLKLLGLFLQNADVGTPTNWSTNIFRSLIFDQYEPILTRGLHLSQKCANSKIFVQAWASGLKMFLPVWQKEHPVSHEESRFDHLGSIDFFS